jgi:predicted nuclease of predicted toxin-antitoxin system
MKLLFDQNISYKLVNRLADVYPGSKHVRQVGLGEADDLVVWDYAKGNDKEPTRLYFQKGQWVTWHGMMG